MDMTPIQIARWANANMTMLENEPTFGTQNEMHRFVAKTGGISLSLVQKFHTGAKPNPTVNSLDKIVKGVQAARKKAGY
jgi:hypothetical protein